VQAQPGLVIVEVPPARACGHGRREHDDAQDRVFRHALRAMEPGEGPSSNPCRAMEKIMREAPCTQLI